MKISALYAEATFSHNSTPSLACIRAFVSDHLWVNQLSARAIRILQTCSVLFINYDIEEDLNT